MASLPPSNLAIAPFPLAPTKHEVEQLAALDVGTPLHSTARQTDQANVAIPVLYGCDRIQPTSTTEVAIDHAVHAALDAPLPHPSTSHRLD